MPVPEPGDLQRRLSAMQSTMQSELQLFNSTRVEEHKQPSATAALPCRLVQQLPMLIQPQPLLNQQQMSGQGQTIRLSGPTWSTASNCNRNATNIGVQMQFHDQLPQMLPGVLFPPNLSMLNIVPNIAQCQYQTGTSCTGIYQAQAQAQLNCGLPGVAQWKQIQPAHVQNNQQMRPQTRPTPDPMQRERQTAKHEPRHQEDRQRAVPKHDVGESEENADALPIADREQSLKIFVDEDQTPKLMKSVDHNFPDKESFYQYVQPSIGLQSDKMRGCEAKEEHIGPIVRDDLAIVNLGMSCSGEPRYLVGCANDKRYRESSSWTHKSIGFMSAADIKQRYPAIQRRLPTCARRRRAFQEELKCNLDDIDLDATLSRSKLKRFNVKLSTQLRCQECKCGCYKEKNRQRLKVCKCGHKPEQHGLIVKNKTVEQFLECTRAGWRSERSFAVSVVVRRKGEAHVEIVKFVPVDGHMIGIAFRKVDQLQWQIEHLHCCLKQAWNQYMLTRDGTHEDGMSFSDWERKIGQLAAVRFT